MAPSYRKRKITTSTGLYARMMLTHKITNSREIATAKRVVDILQSVQHLSELGQIKPKKQEIDAFHLKALVLLQQQGVIDTVGLEEAISLIHRTSLETTPIETAHGAFIQLHQVISSFPGEDFEIKGLFRRDSAFSDISMPIKESFHLTKTIHQSGFPHPLQYIGMAFHECLFPHPHKLHLFPKLSALLQVKHEIAEKLLSPKERIHKKAKQLLQMRYTLFKEKSSLQALLKTYIQALCQTEESEEINSYFEYLEQEPHAFEQLSCAHAQMSECVFAKPIAYFRHEFLDIPTQDPEKVLAASRLILETQIEEMCSHLSLEAEPKTRYQSALGRALGNPVTSLYLLQLSEHLGFSPPQLTQFEKAMLTSLFRQALVFADELHNFPDDISLEMFEEYLVEQIEEETALFGNIPSSHPHTQAAIEIADELLGSH
ncbi:MAG: hypothetical protein JSR46_07470 [Verrucomicrobia bacterium]|nr:hypothetical protein [Verrucomicrobiota bacterium]